MVSQNVFATVGPRAYQCILSLNLINPITGSSPPIRRLRPFSAEQDKFDPWHRTPGAKQAHLGRLTHLYVQRRWARSFDIDRRLLKRGRSIFASRKLVLSQLRIRHIGRTSLSRQVKVWDCYDAVPWLEKIALSSRLCGVQTMLRSEKHVDYRTHCTVVTFIDLTMEVSNA